MKPYQSVADVLDVNSDYYQTSQSSEILQMKGKSPIRKCDEPAYTVRTTTPSAIVTDFDIGIESITDTEDYRRMGIDELKKIQTFETDFEIPLDNVTDKRKLIGNAVPVDLAQSIASVVEDKVGERT